MPASAFALALGAAVLHATWNAVLAGSRDVRAATTVALATSVVVMAPVAVATWSVEREAVPWIAASSVLEVVYFLLLAAAYQRSDLSLVYPIARGSAPILVLLGASVVGATIGAWQALGVVLVGAGVLLVRGLGGHTDGRGAALALAIGATIAGYTLVDEEAIEHAATVPYLVLVLAPAALVALAVQLGQGGIASVRAELGVRTVGAGILALAAYLLVLAALDLAAAPSVSAVRETSVLFAVALGALALRERVSPSRVAGAVLVVAGVVLVALA